MHSNALGPELVMIIPLKIGTECDGGNHFPVPLKRFKALVTEFN